MEGRRWFGVLVEGASEGAGRLGLCCDHGAIGEWFMAGDGVEVQTLLIREVLGDLRGAVAEALPIRLVRFLH